MNGQSKLENTVQVNGALVRTPNTKGHLVMPTWAILVALVLSLVVIKTFIYIKDEKRHGK